MSTSKEELILAKPASELTMEELQELSKMKQKQERKKREKKRKDYEDKRELLVKSMCNEALQVNRFLKDFKQQSFSRMETFYDTMKAYGQISKDNKGSFSIKSADGSFKVEFSNQIIKSFDERAEAGYDHIQTFLKAFVRVKDQSSYELVTSLLERNQDGKFDVKLINRLLKMRDKFDDENWQRGLDLFTEAYQEHGTSQYIRFYKSAPGTDKLTPIQLNFPSIELDSKDE